MVDTLNRDIFSGEDVCINRVPVTRTSLHNHDFLEIALVEEGSGQHLIDSVELEVTAGDYFIIDRNVMHQFSSESGMIVCNCMFTPQFLDLSMIGIDRFSQMAGHFPYVDLDAREGELCPEFRFRADPGVFQLFREMYQEFCRKDPGYLRILQADIQKLLVLSLRQGAWQSGALPEAIGEPYRNVLKFIRHHYDMPLTLEQLAGMAYVSPEHFSRQFKRCTGKTVTDYIRQVRMDAAGKLLVETDLPLDLVAQHVGYHDPRHFSRLFREQKGLPPIRYRKQNR